MAEKFLSVNDYLDAYDKIEANFNPRMKSAERKIAIATNYDPELDKSGELRNFNRLDKQKYNIIYDELYARYAEARRTKSEFDPNTVVREIISSTMGDLKKEDKKIKLNAFAPQARSFFKKAEKMPKRKKLILI